MRSLITFSLSLLVVGCASQLPETSLQFGDEKLYVDIAATDRERQRGMMSRTELGESEGLLFIFPDAGKKCLWMRSTPLPLSAAFVDSEGYVLNIEKMQPESEDIHCSEGNAKYAVETHQGWFERRGVNVGDKVGGLPMAAPARSR